MKLTFQVVAWRAAALSVFIMATSSSAQVPRVIPVWPNVPPGSPTTPRAQEKVERPLDERGPITRLTNIDRPTIEFYRAQGTAQPAPAVLVFPGGGYQYIAVDAEGSEVCIWLSQAGIACGVVHYRVPATRENGVARLPLQDGERAVRVARDRAAELGIDPHRVGVMGFSAGGDIAARLSNLSGEKSYSALDMTDEQSARPDFAVLIYPCCLVGNAKPPQLVPAVRPTAATPPTFLVQTEDDPVGVANSVEYHKALEALGVPTEFHEYPKGGHGYGMRPGANDMSTVWPPLALAWIRAHTALPR